MLLFNRTFCLNVWMYVFSDLWIYSHLTIISLSKQRKARKVDPNTAAVENIEQYTVLSSHPIHKASQPGITCLDIHPQQELIATGGNDHDAIVFNRVEEKVSLSCCSAVLCICDSRVKICHIMNLYEYVFLCSDDRVCYLVFFIAHTLSVDCW